MGFDQQHYKWTIYLQAWPGNVLELSGQAQRGSQLEDSRIFVVNLMQVPHLGVSPSFNLSSTG